MQIWKPPKIWKDGECFIIGGGPSLLQQFAIPTNLINDVVTGLKPLMAYSPYLESIHNRHIIGINNAYQLGIWVDVMFFGDNSYYLAQRNKLSKWPGIKISCASRIQNYSYDKYKIRYMAKNKKHKFGITSDSGMVSWNGNSGAAAISVAVQLGVKRIILLGFDMKIDKYSHWFGSHGRKIKSPPFKRHLKGFPQISKDAKILGIEILNASLDSAIDKKLIKRVSLSEIL